MNPVKIVDILWNQAGTIVEPPQVAVVIVNEANGILAFRHNCLGGCSDLIIVLRQLADKLEKGDFAENTSNSLGSGVN